MPDFTLRAAVPSDMAALGAIYAPYVLETTVSFETSPPDDAERLRIFESRRDSFPWLVAEDAGGILGYACAGRLAARPGYDWAAETTIYLAQNRRGRGVGRALYTALLGLLAAQGYCEAYAIIASPNPESEGFHEKMGFRREGLLTRAGRKLGRVVAVAYWAKTLREDDGAPPPIMPLSALPAAEVERIQQDAMSILLDAAKETV